MPEGPSIVILKEAIIPLFKKRKIINAYGNAKIDKSKLTGKKIKEIKSWGKQLLIYVDDSIIRIHLLMFGSYSVDENVRPARSLRLALHTSRHTLYFYTCSVRLLTEDGDKEYDWSADVMSPEWDPGNARKKLKALATTKVCDVLLDQQLFSGVGNIIKNEVLYRIKTHPENKIRDLPSSRLSALIKEVRNYSFDFLKWKKEYTLKKHWLVHTKKICLRCNLPIIKKYCGKTMRRTFFCTGCQVLYKKE
jgi:endonuclease VIII